jgi:hypothetical protein
MTKSETAALLAKIDAALTLCETQRVALADFGARLDAVLAAAKAPTPPATPAPTPAPTYKRWDADKFARVVAKLRTIEAFPARIAYLKHCIGIDPAQKEAAYAAAKQ